VESSGADDDLAKDSRQNRSNIFAKNEEPTKEESTLRHLEVVGHGNVVVGENLKDYTANEPGCRR